MKRPVAETRRARRSRRERNGDHVTRMLRLCLEKVCELQADLMRSEEAEAPEAAGYAACALETVRFLAAQGLPPDHPVVKSLTDKLMGARQ